MKHFNVFASAFLLLILAAGCSKKLTDTNRIQQTVKVSDKVVCDSLKTLFWSKDYFAMKDYLNQNRSLLSDKDTLSFAVFLNNRFFKNEASSDAFYLLEQKGFGGIDSLFLKKLFDIQAENLFLLGRYQAASVVSDTLITRFAKLTDSAEMSGFIAFNKVVHAIANKPAMTVRTTGSIDIPITRDMANLLNVNTKLNDTTVNFVFDSGANLSVMQRSIAEELGYDIIDCNFSTNWATGKAIICDIAVVDSVIIGNKTIKNVVFIVMDDAELTFKDAGYEINGIIGFPIIRALNEIQFTRDHHLRVPEQPTDYALNNLCNDDLMPIIRVNYGADYLLFGFDTGANATSLYSMFYEKYKTFIDRSYKRQDFSFGSGGGKVTYNGYILDSLKIEIAGQTQQLDSIQLHVDKIGTGDYRHGNLGQDFMKQFETMIISFASASVVFKN